MNNKLITTLIVVHSIVYMTAQKPFAGDDFDKFEYNCNLLLSSMNFLYNQRCVQLIVDHRLYPVECMEKIMENSENVTFYVRSQPWLLNRNIHVEESSSNTNNKKSTKYCEIFLIVLKDVFSLKSLLNAVKNSASVVTFFPYTKLYFMFFDNTQFMPSQTMTKISKFFYENSQFGYAYELDAVTRTLKLRDLLTLNIESNHTIKTNLIHPFVNRENNRKEFRLSFYNCSPFIIYVDEENLR